MKIRRMHGWNLDNRQAVQLQRELAGRVIEGPPLEHAETVAAADVSAGKREEWIIAAVVVMRLADFAVLETREAGMKAAWPYVPGCLSFREAPVVLEAFRKLRTVPDVIIIDGQGRAHPRRLGLASHIGLALEVPTVGCAKSRLIGEVRGGLGLARGSRAALWDAGERIGTVLRTRTGVKPVYVSVGHRIDLASAERWVLAAAPRYRLPEPARMAHQRVTRQKKECIVRDDPQMD
ncbi:MAG: deoxyribonuclease V [Planctomycetota bacterium]|nr:deoxyribonuclease V [Planctomycetota bacterium]